MESSGTDETRNRNSGQGPSYLARCQVDSKDWVKLGFDRSVKGQGSIYLCFEVGGDESQEDIYLDAKDAEGLRDTLTELLQQVAKITSY